LRDEYSKLASDSVTYPEVQKHMPEVRTCYVHAYSALQDWYTE
jgi:hypothetical protein